METSNSLFDMLQYVELGNKSLSELEPVYSLLLRHPKVSGMNYLVLGGYSPEKSLRTGELYHPHWFPLVSREHWDIELDAYGFNDLMVATASRRRRLIARLAPQESAILLPEPHWGIVKRVLQDKAPKLSCAETCSYEGACHELVMLKPFKIVMKNG